MSHEFGYAPICPKGFTSDLRVEALNDERRYYRQLWLDEKKRADALAELVMDICGGCPKEIEENDNE